MAWNTLKTESWIKYTSSDGQSHTINTTDWVISDWFCQGVFSWLASWYLNLKSTLIHKRKFWISIYIYIYIYINHPIRVSRKNRSEGERGVQNAMLHMLPQCCILHIWNLLYANTTRNGTRVNVKMWFRMCDCVSEFTTQASFPKENRGGRGLSAKKRLDIAILHLHIKIPYKQTKIENCKRTRGLPYVWMWHTICPAAANGCI